MESDHNHVLKAIFGYKYMNKRLKALESNTRLKHCNALYVKVTTNV